MKQYTFVETNYFTVDAGSQEEALEILMDADSKYEFLKDSEVMFNGEN
jgi:hypothetical protein